MTRAERAERFWGRVEKTDGCWLYRGVVNFEGYGHYGFKQDGKWHNYKAHRYAWLTSGRTIPAGMCLLHVARDRHARGERNKQNKLTAADVVAIRAAFWNNGKKGVLGRSNAKELGKKYGVRPNTISNIAYGHAWKHVPSHLPH